MNREKNLMAKAKETKVKNLRLRRRIRKTVGALFMASAVAVAAIPVQDIEAEDYSQGWDQVATFHRELD